jgi:dephospho-CoA kinase
MLDLFDSILIVVAPAELRLSRLVDSGKSREDSLARMKAQLPESALTDVADAVIVNDGTLEELRERVDRYWSSLPVNREGT